MGADIDAELGAGKIVFAAGGFFLADGELFFGLLDVLVAALAEDAVFLLLPCIDLLLEIDDALLKGGDFIGGDGLKLGHEILVLRLFVGQFLDADELAGDAGMIRNLRLAGGDEAFDFPLDGLEAAQGGFDLAEAGELDFQLALEAVLADERLAIVRTRAGDGGAALEQAIGRDGGVVVREFRGGGDADDIAEERVDVVPRGHVAGAENFGEGFFRGRMAGADPGGVDEALRAGLEEIGLGQGGEDFERACVILRGNEDGEFFLKRDFGGGAPCLVLDLAKLAQGAGRRLSGEAWERIAECCQERLRHRRQAFAERVDLGVEIGFFGAQFAEFLVIGSETLAELLAELIGGGGEVGEGVGGFRPLAGIEKADGFLHARHIEVGVDGCLGSFLHPLAGGFQALGEAAVDLGGEGAEAFDIGFELADAIREILVEAAFGGLIEEGDGALALLAGFLGEIGELDKARLVLGEVLAQFREAAFHAGDFCGGVFPCVLGGEIGGDVLITLGFPKGFRELADVQELVELGAEFTQLALVGFEVAEAGGDVLDGHRLGGQHELAAEIVEAFEVRERHRAGQQALEDFLVEIEVAGVRHVAEVFARGGEDAPALGLDHGLELREGAGAGFPVLGGNGEEILTLQAGGAVKRGVEAVVFRGVAELEAQPPCLLPLAVRPGEFPADVGGDAFVVEILRLAVFLAFRVEQAVALDGAVAAGAGGAAVEMMARTLRADEDEHEKIHQDGFPRAGDSR